MQLHITENSHNGGNTTNGKSMLLINIIRASNTQTRRQKQNKTIFVITLLIKQFEAGFITTLTVSYENILSLTPTHTPQTVCNSLCSILKEYFSQIPSNIHES